MLRRFHCGKRSARDYVSFRFGQEIGIAARLRNRRDFSVCSPLSEQSNGRDQWMDGWTDRHHPREQGTRVGGHWWRWRGRRVFTCGLLRVGEWQGSSRPPMANFHHETVDDDDTIELSVEARSGDDAVSFKKSEGSRRRRQTIQIPRASQPTNFLTKNGVHYELSSSSSSRRRRRRRRRRRSRCRLTPRRPRRQPRSVGRDCCATVGRRHQ